MLEADVVPAPALDREAYAELVDEIGEPAAREIRDVFISETNARLKLLHALSPARERIRISREAHSLKSAAGAFGYRHLASLAVRLEGSVMRLSTAEYAELLDDIDEAYRAARELDLQQ
jgi:HPt (histidine-containing phosphotransfer) domain-containing protein